MNTLFYWGVLLLLFVFMYAALRFGVKLGRVQEYAARTQPLLAELVWIKEATAAKPPVAHLHLSYRVEALLKKYGLQKKER